MAGLKSDLTPHQEMAAGLLEDYEDGMISLSAWEIEFIEKMLDEECPSPKQQEKLIEIADFRRGDG